MRAPFQVLVFTYKPKEEKILFLPCLRSDLGFWQPISGEGEDAETLLEAAKRELYEQTALVGVNWLQLDSMCTLPKTIFNDHMYWPKHLHVVPEYAFSVEVQGDPLLSSEHSEYRWCDAVEAQKLLKSDSNRVALWELCERLKAQGKRIPELDRF